MEHQETRQVFSSASASGDGVREWLPVTEPASAPHEVGSYVANGKELFRIALAKPTRTGAHRTTSLAATLVHHLRPRCLVMCGVCAGNPNYVALGDIIVSELTYQYDEGKVEADKFLGDHRQWPISHDWLRAAKALNAEELPSYGPPTSRDAEFWLLERLFEKDQPASHPARPRYFAEGDWRQTVERLENDGLIRLAGASLLLTKEGISEVKRRMALDVDPPATLPIAIKTGPIASGNVVVKDGRTWDKLEKLGVRTILGLEMEGASIGEVAQTSGVEKWIVIKGVMDHADLKKNDRYKVFAARAAAEVMRQFLHGRFIAHPSDRSTKRDI
jgi:nucleoside phosphorylase